MIAKYEYTGCECRPVYFYTAGEYLEYSRRSARFRLIPYGADREADAYPGEDYRNLLDEKTGKEDTRMADRKKKMNWDELSPDDKMKYEIAEELGLLEQVKAEGWKSLTAKDTGRIGGLMTKRKREEGRKK